MDTQQHPLSRYPEDERVDYLRIVGTLAAADGRIADSEITTLRTFCETIGISGIGIGMILVAVENPAVVEVQIILTRLIKTALKFTLLTDMLFLAQADGIVCPKEQAEIQKIAAWLQIAPAQLDVLNTYVEVVIAAQQSQRAEAKWQNRGRELAAEFAGIGIPVGAVAIAGSLMGGRISAGLNALGQGLDMLTGVSATVSLRATSYVGVRWLLKQLLGE